MEHLKIIFADDHLIMREGVRMLLEQQQVYKMEILEASNGQQAIDLYKINKGVDVVIMDIRMPVKDGIAACMEIKAFDPKAKIIFLSMQDEEYTIKRAMQAGARGYILKNSGMREIMDAIAKVLRGVEHISAEVVSRFMHNYVVTNGEQKKKKHNIERDELTKRERDVLELISMEKTSQEIAKQLDLSKRTVEKHRCKLMCKLGAKSTVGLIKNAINQGWISSESQYA
ncbi:MAG: response regulator [Flavobacteriales bacterium]